ncbi:MAG: flagellar basal body P-ring protein FlgI [Vicinamibacterales bacterium]
MSVCTRLRTSIAATLAGLLIGAPLAGAADTSTRLKDIASIQGVESIPLIGYGLVVGLNKTGDKRQTIFTAQTIANMLERFGLSVPGQQIKIENVAAVLVTAELPAYSRPGARIDITASSIGDARSLQGGTLLATPLRGGNGTVYALAQGPLSIGGFGGGGGGNSVQVNHLTVGRVPSGAQVQVGAGGAMPTGDVITLALREPDFVSAARIVEAVNSELGPDQATVVDPGSITIRIPQQYKNAVPSLMARLEVLPVQTDVNARVVINERTGTVVVGGQVRIGPAAVAHGNLSVRISTKYEVSQPNPLSRTGDTTVVPNTSLDVQEKDAKLVSLEEGTTLEAVVRALNALGATPRDIIAIMQALKVAGALRAELVVL